jgi:hypothetical protein
MDGKIRFRPRDIRKSTDEAKCPYEMQGRLDSSGPGIPELSKASGACRWSFPVRLVVQFFFSSDPVLDILPRPAAALNIQLVSSVSDIFLRYLNAFDHDSLFFGYFFAFSHGNLLDCRREEQHSPLARNVHGLPVVAEMLILICFGLGRYSSNNLGEGS